jgi:prohibitin 2
MVTLGKVSSDFLPEGLAFKLPFISKVVSVSVQQQTKTNSTGCFSSDLQQVNFTYAILYKVPENKVVELYRNYKGEVDTSLIYPRIEEILKQVTAMHRAEELVKKRDVIKVAVLEELREVVSEIVEIKDFSITNMDFTEELEKAIELKVVREQEALAKKYELEKVQKDAEMTMVAAKAEAESVKIRGEALKNSPNVIDLEIIKKWNGIAPTTVVTGGNGSIILPLNTGK